MWSFFIYHVLGHTILLLFVESKRGSLACMLLLVFSNRGKNNPLFLFNAIESKFAYLIFWRFDVTQAFGPPGVIVAWPL